MSESSLAETCAKLRELLTKATPGPWHEYQNCLYGAVYAGSVPITHSRMECAPCWHVDAALIVAMHNALPGLIMAADATANANRLRKALSQVEYSLSVQLAPHVSAPCTDSASIHDYVKRILAAVPAERDGGAGEMDARIREDRIDAMAYRRGAYELNEKVKPEMDSLRAQLADMTERHAAAERCLQADDKWRADMQANLAEAIKDRDTLKYNMGALILSGRLDDLRNSDVVKMGESVIQDMKVLQAKLEHCHSQNYVYMKERDDAEKQAGDGQVAANKAELEADALRAALMKLLPLAEWALMEQSPTCADQALVDAAKKAIGS